MNTQSHVRTDRLRLDVPVPGDLPAIFAIYSDPAVWTHVPTLRHSEEQQTAVMLHNWIDGWERDGLGQWIVRDETGTVLGHVGCSIRDGEYWNLGYRLAARAHGRGFATEAAQRAVEATRVVQAELPVVAYLLEHNLASANVAEKVGLTLRHRAPDAGNPDPTAVRVVYADRELTPRQLTATLR